MRLFSALMASITKDAIYKKVERLGSEVVDEVKKNVSSTTSLELPEEMPSIGAKQSSYSTHRGIRTSIVAWLKDNRTEDSEMEL